ncbi:MAG: tyrosine decarboxylase MfnA [Candidatus Thorarchaeota archaeon]
MFAERGTDAEDVIRSLEDVLKKDCTYRSGRPVASMSTIPHSLGIEILTRYAEKNAGRLHSFPGTAIIEKELIEMLGDLLHLEAPLGTTTSGGTESNILAVLSHRELGRRRTTGPEIVAPETVHPSVDKAAWLLGIRIKKTPVDDEYRAMPSEMEKQITCDTVGLVATAGTTYVGQIDPIESIASIARDHGLPLHVDAAFGGFVIPFLRDLGMSDHRFDFEIEGVTSVSIDPHKMGLAPIPAGCLLMREKDHLDAITRTIPYLRGTSSRQSTLLGTRPASTILSAWAIMKHLGREGYRNIVRECMRNTQHSVDRIAANPRLELVIRPVMNIVAFRVQEEQLDQVADRMESMGWSTAISPLPPSMRLIVMPHVTGDVLDDFFDDLDTVLRGGY